MKIKKESVLDLDLKTLDKNVFDFPKGKPPIIKPEIKKQILNGIKIIDKRFTVKDILLIGSILSSKFSPTSDIDITIEIPGNKYKPEDYKELLRKINGHFAKNTKHPINFHIIEHPYNVDNTDNIYDVVEDKWIKKTKLSNVHLQEITKKFEEQIQGIDLKKAKLKRNIVDLKLLKSLDEFEVKDLQKIINEKIKEISVSINELLKIYIDLKENRAKAFEKPIEKDKLKKLGSKNNLPENIIYKLYEKYYYLEIFQELKDLTKERQIKLKDLLKIF